MKRQPVRGMSQTKQFPSFGRNWNSIIWKWNADANIIKIYAALSGRHLNYCFFPQGVAIGPGYIGPSARGIALNERYRIFNAHALKGQYNLAQGIALGEEISDKKWGRHWKRRTKRRWDTENWMQSQIWADCHSAKRRIAMTGDTAPLGAEYL